MNYFGFNLCSVGAMIDFTPLLQMPSMLFFGAAAQFGIFMTIIFAYLLGFDIKEAASIGIIGAADGPTSIFVATRFCKTFARANISSRLLIYVLGTYDSAK